RGVPRPRRSFPYPSTGGQPSRTGGTYPAASTVRMPSSPLRMAAKWLDSSSRRPPRRATRLISGHRVSVSSVSVSRVPAPSASNRYRTPTSRLGAGGSAKREPEPEVPERIDDESFHRRQPEDDRVRRVEDDQARQVDEDQEDP